MNKFFKAMLFVLLFIWQMPQNIIAGILALFIGKKKLISYKHWCFAFEAKNFNNGISLGNFCFVDTIGAAHPEYVAHEQAGHTVDSRLFGPLYLVIIGLPSLIHAWCCKDQQDYYDFYTERWANKHAGLTVFKHNGWAYLEFK